MRNNWAELNSSGMEPYIAMASSESRTAPGQEPLKCNETQLRKIKASKSVFLPDSFSFSF